MGGGGGGTQTTALIPDELKPLYQQTANMMMGLQNALPLYGKDVGGGGGGGYGGPAEPPVGGGGMGGGDAANMNHKDGASAGGGGSFIDPNARQVAGLTDMQGHAREGLYHMWDNPNSIYGQRVSENQYWAGAQGKGMHDRDELESRMARNAATGGMGAFDRAEAASRQQVTGDNIANDPALLNQQQVFKATTMPTISNQMGAMGLGRSGAAGNAMANAWAQQATPLMQDAAARQERGIDRQVQGSMGAGQGYMSGANNLTNQWSNRNQQRNMGINAQLGAGQLGLGAGDQFYNQKMGVADRAQAWGEQERQMNQDQYNAWHDDFLRRQGLAEQALFAPFGQMANTIGQQSSGGGK